MSKKIEKINERSLETYDTRLLADKTFFNIQK